MQDYSSKIWEEALPRQLADALMALESKKQIQNFLRDVMTTKEIVEISSRLQAAKMLSNNEKYTDIVAKTRLSSRTIARISDWMKNGSGGYAAALSKLHHDHTNPARAR